MRDRGKVRIRPGGADDVPVVMGLLDGAVRWLVAHGRADQWGTTPHSDNPRLVAKVNSWAEDGELYLAWLAGSPVGALVVGAAPTHVPPAEEPDLYINLLVTDRSRPRRGIGRELLRHARQLARQQGVGLLRVDCYGGGDGALVRYYEREGFTATDRFTVPLDRGPWSGQVLQQRLR